MKKPTSPKSSIFRSINALFLGVALLATTVNLSAATGDELLIGALPASSVNKSVIDGDTLTKAVYDAVLAHKTEAPEIVAAAIPKTRSLLTQKAIVKAAISALGDYKALPKGLIPQIVYSAIKASPNCSSSDGKGGSDDGYAKDTHVGGCRCAEEYTKAAIESLGTDPSERLVDDIVKSAIQATDGHCANEVANAASGVAPQYARSIAEAAASAAREGDFASNDPFNDPLFPNPRPLPAPFVFPDGGLSPATTPVN